MTNGTSSALASIKLIVYIEGRPFFAQRTVRLDPVAVDQNFTQIPLIKQIVTKPQTLQTLTPETVTQVINFVAQDIEANSSIARNSTVLEAGNCVIGQPATCSQRGTCIAGLRTKNMCLCNPGYAG